MKDLDVRLLRVVLQCYVRPAELCYMVELRYAGKLKQIVVRVIRL